MILRPKLIQKFSTISDLAKLLHPLDNQCYFQTSSYGQSITQQDKQNIKSLLEEIFMQISQFDGSLKESEMEFKQKLKEIIPNNYNIESDNGLEWGLKERILQLKRYNYENNIKINLNGKIKEEELDQIRLLGYLEVYGVSPYRHINQYMSDYKYNQEQNSIHFEKRNYVFKEIKKKEGEKNKIQQIVEDGIKKEKNIFQKIKQSIYNFNHLFVDMDKIEQEEGNFQKIKKKLAYNNTIRTNDNHILVRDYLFETSMKLQITRDDQILDFDSQNQIQQNQQNSKFLLRTEIFVDPKESESTKKNKLQVLTDFNWIMKGNPWVWVKRYDLQK